MSKAIETTIKSRIYNKGRGWCFTPSHFADLGSSDAVRQALSRLAKKDVIRRLAFGLYEYQREHKTLGTLPPRVENIIKAVTEKDKIKYQPSGAYAANLLGLSEQVPAKIVLLTDGPSKTIVVGNIKIIFKKTTPKNMMSAGTIAGLIIQALKYLGKEHVSIKALKNLKKKLSDEDRRIIKRDVHVAPDWISKIIKKHI